MWHMTCFTWYQDWNSCTCCSWHSSPTTTHSNCCCNLEKQLTGFYYSPAAEICWKYLSIPMVPAILLPRVQCLSKSKETIANINHILPSLLLAPLWEEFARFQSWSIPTVFFLGTVSEKLVEVPTHLQVWSNALGQALSPQKNNTTFPASHWSLHWSLCKSGYECRRQRFLLHPLCLVLDPCQCQIRGLEQQMPEGSSNKMNIFIAKGNKSPCRESQVSL